MGSLQDPIADLLTRIRNASSARKKFVDIGHSKAKENIVRILKSQGFIAHYLVKEENKKGTIRVFLKYSEDREPIIKGIKRVSKPSLRRYISCNDIPRVLGGMGISVLSTSQGVLDGKSARGKNIGGELLCFVW